MCFFLVVFLVTLNITSSMHSVFILARRANLRLVQNILLVQMPLLLDHQKTHQQVTSQQSLLAWSLQVRTVTVCLWLVLDRSTALDIHEQRERPVTLMCATGSLLWLLIILSKYHQMIGVLCTSVPLGRMVRPDCVFVCQWLYLCFKL